MEFDKSKVFSMLNAEELKIGSEVIVSDSLGWLKERVERGAETSILKEINSDACTCRFNTGDTSFALAYLVSEPVEKELKWTDLKLLDKVVNKKTGRTVVVTAIDPDDNACPVAFGPEWMGVFELKDWEKVD